MENVEDLDRLFGWVMPYFACADSIDRAMSVVYPQVIALACIISSRQCMVQDTLNSRAAS